MEGEDRRFREELRRGCNEAGLEDLDAVVFNLAEESKARQREIFRKHRFGEPVILQFPSDDSPRAA